MCATAKNWVQAVIKPPRKLGSSDEHRAVRNLVEITHDGKVNMDSGMYSVGLTSGRSVSLVEIGCPVYSTEGLSTKQAHLLAGSGHPWLVLRFHNTICGLPKDMWELDSLVVLTEHKRPEIPGKKAYEANKKSMFCVRCDSPTVKKSLGHSVVNYCPCVEEDF